MSRFLRFLAVFLTAFFAMSMLTVSAPAEAAPSWTVLKKPATGFNVVALQYLLKYRGYTLTADGEFGTTTYNAVYNFQSKSGLTPDGVVGSATWPKLITTVQDSTPVNNAVRAAQILLNKHGYGLTVDGDFGPGTRDAVSNFQGRVGITRDGVIGPLTWQNLVGGNSGPSTTWTLPMSKSSFHWGEFWDDPHHDYPAADIGMAVGTSLYAVHAGTATPFSNSTCGLGMEITFDSYRVAYCHMNSRAFTTQRSVAKGQFIGYSGNTGNSLSPHLHFQIRNAADVKVCPQPLLQALFDGVALSPVSSLNPATNAGGSVCGGLSQWR